MEIFDQADMGLLLEVLRVLRHWRQADLAAAAGLHPSTISRYESGQLPIDAPTLQRLTAVAGLPVDWTARTLLPVLAAARRIVESAAAPSPVQAPPEDWTAGALPLAEALQQRLDQAVGLFDARLAAFHAGHRQSHAAPAATDRDQAAAAWARLEPCTAEERGMLVERAPELQTWAFAELLCEESIRAAPKSAEAAMGLARLAVRVAQLLRADAAWQSRVEGYARAFFGNALKVEGNLAAANAAWTKALRLWHAGADPAGLLPEWRLFELEASLRCVTRQFDQALALLDRAAAAAPPDASGRVLLSRAQALEQSGDAAAALAALNAAAPLIRPGGDRRRRLQFALAFNLTVNLCHLGRFAEAEAELRGVGRLADDLGNELDSLHVIWLSARVAGGLGRRAEAQATLAEVQQEWAARRNGVGAARVSLELAVQYLEEGRHAEVCRLADEMTWIFAAQGVEREALAALRLFCDAARQQQATLEQARQVLALLESSARGIGAS